MDFSIFKLCLKMLSGNCRRWIRKLILCLILGMVLLFLWIHTQSMPIQTSRNEFNVRIKSAKHSSGVLHNDRTPTQKKLIHPSYSRTDFKKCPNLNLPSRVLVDTFQPLDDSKSSYFFSAYYDSRNGKHEVRVISLKTSSVSGFWCQMWYDENGKLSLETVQASVSVIPEGSGRLYESIWVVCRSTRSYAPSMISIVSSECNEPHNYLNVTSVITQRPQKETFSLCVTPFNLRYDKVDEFIEIMTMNAILGLDHAYFYNYSSSPRIRKLTDSLVRKGKATVVPWHLPMKVHVWPIPPGYNEEVKYFGQMAMLQDCLMRGMGRYRYLVYTDMDEIAVPRRHRSWIELFKARGISNRKPAVIVFRNTFYKLEWPSDPRSLEDKKAVALNSRLILKTKREKTIYSSGARSKYMIDPLQIRTCGVHNIWQMEVSGAQVEVLGVDDGVLHHYRNWEGLGEKTWVEDRNILRFRDEIVMGLDLANRNLLK